MTNTRTSYRGTLLSTISIDLAVVASREKLDNKMGGELATGDGRT